MRSSNKTHMGSMATMLILINNKTTQVINNNNNNNNNRIDCIFIYDIN